MLMKMFGGEINVLRFVEVEVSNMAGKYKLFNTVAGKSIFKKQQHSGAKPRSWCVQTPVAAVTISLSIHFAVGFLTERNLC